MPRFGIRLAAFREWSDELRLEVVNVVSPAGASTVDLPGPRRVPARSYLELAAGPNGVVGRLLRGDGAVLPVAVWIEGGSGIVQLPEMPLAVSPGAGGHLWVLGGGGLLLVDVGGRLKQRVEVTGIALVGAEDGAVWVVGRDRAWFVDDLGRAVDRGRWPERVRSAAGDGALCCLEKLDPRRLRCRPPAGEDGLVSLAPPPGPFEELLGAVGDDAVTQAGGVLRWYEQGHLAAELTAQAAGVTADGGAFLSSRSDGAVELQLEGGGRRSFLLPASAPNTGPLGAVAVEGDSALVYGQDFGAWYDGDQVRSAWQVDEERYRREVFPHIWRLRGVGFSTLAANGDLLLSATGPTGLAVIAVSRERA